MYYFHLIIIRRQLETWEGQAEHKCLTPLAKTCRKTTTETNKTTKRKPYNKIHNTPFLVTKVIHLLILPICTPAPCCRAGEPSTPSCCRTGDSSHINMAQLGKSLFEKYKPIAHNVSKPSSHRSYTAQQAFR